jgi:hypothetical protein
VNPIAIEDNNLDEILRVLGQLCLRGVRSYELLLVWPSTADPDQAAILRQALPKLALKLL